jgi:polar amino acid transport system substrate-binding protein
MRLKHLFSTLLLAAFSTFTFAADNLVINVDQENPPFMFAKDGKAAGIYPALIAAAFKHMNVAVTIQPEPWKRAIADIDDGVAGVGGIYKNAERLKKYDYSEQLFMERLAVYSNKAAIVNYTKLDDLKGKRIGVIRGWSYGDDFDNARKANAFSAEEANGDAQNFEKLNLGRLDVVIAVSASGDLFMKKYPNLSVAAAALSESPSFLAFSKKANKVDLLKQFDQAIKDMKKSQEFQKIVQAELSK